MAAAAAHQPGALCAVGGGYAYAVQDSTLVVNQHVPGTARVPMAQGEAVLTVDTRYPLDGQVHLHVTGPVQNLRLRKPGWCTSWTLTVNGKNIQPEMQNGYLDVPVQPGDCIAFSMDMPVRVVHDDPRVLENQGRVAVCRGPLVYCAEECDNPGFVREYFHAELPVGTGAWQAQHADMLGGIVLLKNDQRTLIPYYAWDNREPGAMTVWMREECMAMEHSV